MRRKTFMGAIIGFFFTAIGFGAPMTQILYEVNEVDTGRWLYTYDVTNISLTVPVEEFTIWFDFGLYESLTVETPSPLADDWDEIVLQPEPILTDPGAYDAKALSSRVCVGETVSGFAVSFDWLGTGEPSSQYYQIIDPVTFDTSEDGYTVPEPMTLVLLGLGSLSLLSRRNGHYLIQN